MLKQREIGLMQYAFSDPSERPTAHTLLDRHPFCAFDPSFDFTRTTLYELVQDKRERPVTVPVQYA